MGKLKHYDHIFQPVSDGVYLVKCTKTGGEFSSSIWLNEICQNQKCPCCNQQVEKR